MRPLTARLIPLLACALALAGCAPRGAATGPTQPPPPATSAPTGAPAATATASPAAAPTAAPTSAPTAAPTSAPTSAPTAAPTSAPTAAPTSAPAAAGEQILFLRAGDLAALDPASGAVATLAQGVTGFAATPDGRLLALTRGEGAAGEIWVLRRDTGELWQLTANGRAESTLSWAPDGMSLAYTSAPTAPARAPDWQAWSAWCAAAEARIVDLPAAPATVPASAERALGAGCEPAFGPDGRRIVFAAPPAATGELPDSGANNALIMVNRQGENGWRVAIADGSTPEGGLLVYAPAWSPDAGELGYQRFLGYQALVDINLTEAGSSFQRNGAPIGVGAGWLLPPRYSPDGALVAVTEHDAGDARGFGGYDIWTTTVLRLGGSSQLALPSGELTVGASEVGRLRRATAAAWSPDGAALAVALPAGWRADASEFENLYPDEGPAELWRWRAGAAPEARLAEGLEFGSPLLWLPAAPSAARNEAEVALAVPAGWGVREPTAADYWIADGPGGVTIGARLVAGGPPGGPEALFPELIGATGMDDPVFLPDGSMLRGIQGERPGGGRVEGIMRVSPDGAAAAIVVAPAERWPLERARALALLAASGR